MAQVQHTMHTGLKATADPACDVMRSMNCTICLAGILLIYFSIKRKLIAVAFLGIPLRTWCYFLWLHQEEQALADAQKPTNAEV